MDACIDTDSILALQCIYIQPYIFTCLTLSSCKFLKRMVNAGGGVMFLSDIYSLYIHIYIYVYIYMYILL